MAALVAAVAGGGAALAGLASLAGGAGGAFLEGAVQSSAGEGELGVRGLDEVGGEF